MKNHDQPTKSFEVLEARQMLSVEASFEYWVKDELELRIFAQEEGANVSIYQWGNLKSIRDHATDKVTRLPADIQRIHFRGHNGNDRVANLTSLPMTAFAGRGDDYIRGGSATDKIFGDGGSDTLHGGSGDDLIHGHRGDDAIEGGGGNDRIRGGKGDDELSGGPGSDFIYGMKGRDTIRGNEGVDFLFGNESDDFLDGGEGSDWLHGNDGDDELIGGPGVDFLFGNDGADIMEGDSGADILFGGHGNDTIFGGSGVDRIYGQSGDDHLFDDERTGNHSGKNCVFVFCVGHRVTIVGGPGVDYENGEIHEEDRLPVSREWTVAAGFSPWVPRYPDPRDQHPNLQHFTLTISPQRQSATLVSLTNTSGSNLRIHTDSSGGYYDWNAGTTLPKELIPHDLNRPLEHNLVFSGWVIGGPLIRVSSIPYMARFRSAD